MVESDRQQNLRGRGDGIYQNAERALRVHTENKYQTAVWRGHRIIVETRWLQKDKLCVGKVWNI